MGRRRRGWIAGATALLLVAASVLAGAAPAAIAADGDVEIQKTASVSTVQPGQTFTYTIAVSCTTILAGCTNATITDPVPDEFEVLGATVGTGLQGNVTINGQTVDVDFTMPIVGGSTGLPAGTTGVVTIQVRARDDLPYEANGIPVPNTATSDADTQASGPLDSTATVTPVVTLDLATTVGKTMDPASAVANPGTPVTATITASNDSNANVDSITISDPVDPNASPNPFDTLPFTGIDAVTYPDGADQAQVLVWDGTDWIPGPVATPPDVPQAPASVADENVLGVQIVFTDTDGSGISQDAQAGAQIGMEHGPDVQSSPDNVTVTNTAQSEVDLDGASATDEDSATHQILAEDVEVLAGKTFNPTQVSAGDDSTATLTASNNSDFPLTDMTVTEPSLTGDDPFADGFDGSMQFTGFTGPVQWPAGATGATVTYYYDDGTTEQIPFANGATPPNPNGTVVRFQITFTGEIQPTAQTSIPFGVATDPDQAGYPAEIPNEVEVTGTGPIGGQGSDTADATLEVFERHLEMITDKSIYPSSILDRAGEWVLVSLNGQIAQFPQSTTDATQVVIQDPEVVPYAVDGTFWDDFNATEITQTSVPANARLSINYWDGDSWEPLPGAQDIQGPTTPPQFSMEIPPDLQDDILGLQFVYTADDDEPFPPGTTFEPHFSAEKRADERDDTTTTVAPADIQNCGNSSASAPGVAGTPTPGATDCAPIHIDPFDPDEGPDSLDKSISPQTVVSRTQSEITADLMWSTGGLSGVEQIRIQDEADPPANASADLAQSFYDAFDLVRIPSITTAMDPHLIYDQIAGVQLWNGSSWQDLANDPCPAACDGGFPGVTLTPADRAIALGVRLIVVESPTRSSAVTTNPPPPPVGSGVTRSSGNDRHVNLVFELRDTRRSDGAPAMGDLDYNVVDGDPAIGTVNNVANVTGTDSSGATVINTDDADSIGILDVPLNVTLNKSWSNSPFGVPPDNVPQEDYPTGRVTLTATNETAAKVDSLGIQDPLPGASENPFTYFNLVRFVTIPIPSGATSTVVTLDRDTDGDGVADSQDSYGASAALALTEAQLTNVVGVQIAYDGRIDAGASAAVRMDLRLRQFVRGEPGVRVSEDDSPVENAARATVDDAGGGAAGNITTDDATASVDLTEIDLSVVATKSFSPDTQTEPNDSPVVMTLTGQPTGSARTYGMRIEDTSPTFWNAFDYAGIDQSFTLTEPINLVRMSVYTGGTFDEVFGNPTVTGGSWTAGPWLTQAEFLADPFPGIDALDVQGVRFEFLDDDDGDGQDAAQWENPTTPLQAVPVLVQRRADLRTGGEVPSDRSDLQAAPGESAPGVFSNEQSTYICAFVIQDCVDRPDLWATDTADDQMHYAHAISAVEIDKSPVDGAAYEPDTVIPYQITVTNTGDWPIENPVITDDPLQDGDLVVDPYNSNPDGPFRYALSGDAPTPPTGLPMPTDPAAVTLDQGGGAFTFTFPAGTVLEVGQSYTISIDLMFRVGLPGNSVVDNEATVTGDRPFDECNGATGPVQECSAATSVVVVAAGATRSGKAVRVLDDDLGSFDAQTGAEGCAPNAPPIVDPDNEGFSWAACVPRSKPGGDVEWRFAILNTGNIPMDRLVMIDKLPVPGDTGVLSGLARNSEYAALFNGGLELVQPSTGATMTYLVTTGTVCADDLTTTLTPTCPAGSWVDPATVSDLSTVTGVKVTVELAPGFEIQPGDTVMVDGRTITPATAPALSEDPIAWNTVATGAHLTAEQSNGSNDMRPIEGTKTGVALATGSLQVVKTVSGPGADFAPDTFDVQLQCTSAVGTDVEEALPPIDLTLTANQVQTVDDLPWGAHCDLLEGDNGQASASGTGGVVVSEDPIGTATLDNRYELASLQLTKAVDSDAVDANGDPITYGPFEASVDCTFLGEPVWADGYTASPMLVEIEDGETVSLDGLPAGAECTVSETDTDGAASTVITGSTGAGDVAAGDEGGIALVLTADDQGDPTNEALITNTFGVGSLTIDKVIEPVDSPFAGGPYVAHVVCTLDGDTTWSGDVVFDAASDDPATDDDDTDLTATIDNIAAGSTCTVTETNDGFANESSVDPSSVTVPLGSNVSVTITNTYLEGSLTVHKVLEGDTTWAPDSFEVSLRCIDLDAGTPIVNIPGGATRVLNTANSFTTTYDPLPAGALCILSETDTGGAASSEIQNENGTRIGFYTVQPGDDREFSVVNTFETGELQVTKQTSGDGAALWGTNEFEVELACTAVLGGVQQSIDIPGGADRTLAAGETVTYDHLPSGATCTVTEIGDGGASDITITPNNGTDTTVGTATVNAATPVVLTVDNTFDLGQIIVNKTITGAGAQWGNGEFTVSLACTWDGSGTAVDITIPGGAERTLSRANGLTTTYDDLPDGAVCTLTEVDAADASGTTITPSTVTVTPGAAITINVDNRFDAGSIHVVKTFSGPGADLGRNSTFTVALACTSTISGNDGEIAIPGGATRVLRRLNGFSTTYNGLPNGAECQLTETNDGGATDVTITPNSGDATVGTVTVAENETVQLAVDNFFDSGDLIIDKVVDGPGAEFFGAGPFTMHVTCTLDTSDGSVRTVYDEDVVLGGDKPLEAVVTGIPTGSICNVEETDDSVADESVVEPSQVIIGTGEDEPVTVTATNTFLIGSVHVQKVVTGGGAAEFGAGPFEVTVKCIDPASGFQLVNIPGGAVRELSAANDYETTYEALPVGALCGIAETDDGGADAKRLLDENGDEIGLITLDNGSRAGFFEVRDGVERSFVLENTFDPPLPVTGGDLKTMPVWIGLSTLLVGAGVMLVLAARRRRRDETD